jgi:hypothetical protein
VIFLRLHEYLHFYMFAADLGDALAFGHVYAATRVMEKSAGDELVGTLGLPPDGFPLSVLIVNAPVTQPDAGTPKLLLMSD